MRSSLTRSLGLLEGFTGVRVAAVAPGVVRTPLWTENPDKLSMVNEERDAWVTPREVAEAMLALVQDAFAGTDHAEIPAAPPLRKPCRSQQRGRDCHRGHDDGQCKAHAFTPGSSSTASLRARRRLAG